jgi:AraC-like DNA-binding protein
MRHSEPIYGWGLKQKPRGYEFSTENYEQFQVIYVTFGCVYMEHHKQVTPCTTGHVLLLPPRSSFRLSCGEPGYRGIFFAAWNDDTLTGAGEAVAIMAESRVRQVVNVLRRELAQPGAYSDAILKTSGRLLALLTIEQAADAGIQEPSRLLAQRIQQALDASVWTNMGIVEILSGFRHSYRQLARVFTHQHGLSPKSYHLAARLGEAERLLRETNVPITAIAYELGFSSSQHLATLFRKRTGVTPTHFRRNVRTEHRHPDQD